MCLIAEVDTGALKPEQSITSCNHFSNQASLAVLPPCCQKFSHASRDSRNLLTILSLFCPVSPCVFSPAPWTLLWLHFAYLFTMLGAACFRTGPSFILSIPGVSLLSSPFPSLANSSVALQHYLHQGPLPDITLL